MTLPPTPTYRYTCGVTPTQCVTPSSGMTQRSHVPTPMEPVVFTGREEGIDLRAITGTWGLASVKMREEKAVADRFRNRGLSVYLPLRSIERRYGPRIKTIDVAVCVGSIFVCWPDDAAYREAWNVRGMFDIRREPFQDRIVQGMIAFDKAIKSDSKKEFGRWQKGKPCAIRRGHDMAGQQGWLLEDRQLSVVQFGYLLLGQVVKLEIDTSFVELLDAANVAA
jgi:hypothetical protein